MEIIKRKVMANAGIRLTAKELVGELQAAGVTVEIDIDGFTCNIDFDDNNIEVSKTGVITITPE